ncbi:MAG: hypothetical protein P8M78_15465 [Myxococcota bacterium]|nr:hypothetical protein [Myxococcota bacterium]
MTARQGDARHSIDFMAALSFQRASRFLLMLCLVAQAGAGLVSAEEGSDRYVISEGTLWRSDTGVNEAIEGEFEWRTGPFDPLSGVWPIYPRLLAAGSGRPLPEELVFLDWRLEAGDVSVSQLEVAPGARFPRRTFVNAPHFEFNESGDRIQSFSLTGAQRIDDASDTPTYRFYTWSGEGLVGNPEWNADGTPRLPDEMVLEGTLTTYEETYLLSDPSDDDLCRRILSPFLDVEHEPSPGGLVGREPSTGGSSHLYQLGNGPNPFSNTGVSFNWMQLLVTYSDESTDAPPSIRTGPTVGLSFYDVQPGTRVSDLPSRQPFDLGTPAPARNLYPFQFSPIFGPVSDGTAPVRYRDIDGDVTLVVLNPDEFEDELISIRESVNPESDWLEAPTLAELGMEAPSGATVTLDQAGVLTVRTVGDLFYRGDSFDVPGLTRLVLYAGGDLYIEGNLDLGDADLEFITRPDELLPPIDDPGCRDQVVVGPREEVGDFSFVLTREHTVGVDVWPGRSNRAVRLLRDRRMTVALWGSADLDVRDVDLRSLRLGPDEAPARSLRRARRFRRRGRDLNGDGYPDLRLRFHPRRSGLQSSDTEVCLTGRLHDGTALRGCDRSVRIVDGRPRRARLGRWRY